LFLRVASTYKHAPPLNSHSCTELKNEESTMIRHSMPSPWPPLSGNTHSAETHMTHQK
jgi:hypothetical protein